jgi:hypothetical protein
MLVLKVVLAVVLFSCFLYAVISVFPRKLRLIRRLGPEATNDDVLAAAKAGDHEAQDLAKKSRRLLWIAIPSGILLSVLHSASKEKAR